uniref:Lipocalin/cytosolic fatty-acid binding domain-containing protein n=1 Tax=Amblyomma maculatum TaxID=34609 RepID=G3MLB3_AMBMU
MPAFFTLVLVVLGVTTAVMGKLGQPGGPLKLPRENIDIFKVIQSYPSAVAIADTVNDSMQQCLSARRTSIDQEALTATYVWTLQKTDSLPKQEITFNVRPGKEPGTLDMTVGDDPTPKETIVYYADDDCIVMDVEDANHHCLLWIRPELKDSVPQVCTDYFADACGISAPEHSRDLCNDDEADV